MFFLDLPHLNNLFMKTKFTDSNLKQSQSKGKIDLSETPQKKTKRNDINPINNKPYSERYNQILEQRKKLPAWDAKEQLFMLMQKHQCIVLQGETGSGKTTQVPQFLLELFGDK
jgi:pre-mRNA-splicing factor ATP-dependent RNA helicase DHX15/PRP43